MQHLKSITPNFTYYLSAFVPILKCNECYQCNLIFNIRITLDVLPMRAPIVY